MANATRPSSSKNFDWKVEFRAGSRWSTSKFLHTRSLLSPRQAGVTAGHPDLDKVIKGIEDLVSS